MKCQGFHTHGVKTLVALLAIWHINLLLLLHLVLVSGVLVILTLVPWSSGIPL